MPVVNFWTFSVSSRVKLLSNRTDCWELCKGDSDRRVWVAGQAGAKGNAPVNLSWPKTAVDRWGQVRTLTGQARAPHERQNLEELHHPPQALPREITGRSLTRLFYFHSNLMCTQVRVLQKKLTCWPTSTLVKLKVLRWVFAPRTAGSMVSRNNFSINWQMKGHMCFTVWKEKELM